MKCLNDPISVEGQSVVNCNKKYCTILRQELKVNAERGITSDHFQLYKWIKYQVSGANLSVRMFSDIII